MSPFTTLPLSIGIDVGKELAGKLNCPTGQSHQMIVCMRNRNAKDILETSEPKNSRFVDILYFAPVVDKNFLHDTPENLLKKGDFKKAKLMIGFTSNEGSIFLGLVAYSFGLTESANNGVSQAYFRTFLTKRAHHRNNG